MHPDPLPYLDGDAIRAAVGMAELVDAVEDAFRDVAAGRDRSPLRSRVPLPAGDLLLMPGVREGGAGSTVKLVTVVPGNAALGLPTVQAVVVWLDAVTGSPRAILDGETVTAMRTGAASGVATRLLARVDASTLGIIGAGAQAAWQVRGVLVARPIRRVLVYARSEEGREAFARRIAAETGIEVVAVPTPEDAVGDADVVCCATTSSEPVFDAVAVQPGTHVNGIGAFRLDMRELPAALFARASLVTVDALASARAEAGDVMSAVRDGVLDDAALVEIGSVPADYAVGRERAAITVFKSVGLPIQDVAAAQLAVRRLLQD